MRTPRKAICAYCKKVFWHRRETSKYCSCKCFGKAMNTMIERTCKTCGKIFYSQPHRLKSGRGKYCSRQCTDKAMIGTARHLGFKHSLKAKQKIKQAIKRIFPNGRRGKDNPHWKDGKYITRFGYVYVLSPDHPFCNNMGYVAEHRLVMEKHIGRYLRPEETVHHINGIRNDNRLENLMLFPNQRAHTKFHHLHRASS